LNRLGLSLADRIKPTLVSTQVITHIDPYQAQLINRFRHGSMLVAGETMLVLECAPAAYINIACNEAEKTASIKLIHVSSVGRFGRMWLSGSEAEIQTAKNAAVQVLESVVGRDGS
jgi:ethanolamine utilization microcompartment shell protein EutL